MRAAGYLGFYFILACLVIYALIHMPVWVVYGMENLYEWMN